jgi:hypothetical protein
VRSTSRAMPIEVGDDGGVYIVSDHLLRGVDGDMFTTPVRRAASLVVSGICWVLKLFDRYW